MFIDKLWRRLLNGRKHERLKNGEKVVLCGIEYVVTVHEGMVMFAQTAGFYGVFCRLVFERPEYSIWQLKISATFGGVPVAHIIRAFELVERDFGGDFDWDKQVI